MPLVVISAHLALFGEAGALPRRVRERVLPAWLLGALRNFVTPDLSCAERLLHPRRLTFAGREQVLGLVYFSILLLAPPPFFYMPPALCLVLLAWGKVQREGMVVAAGLVCTLATTAALAGLLEWARAVWGRG